MSSTSIFHIPIESVFRKTWLEKAPVVTNTKPELIAYVHWTRPNHFGGRQHFRSAIGLLYFEAPPETHYLLGIIGKSSNRTPWEAFYVESGDRLSAHGLPWTHRFYQARPTIAELREFADSWNFGQRSPHEIVVERFSAIDAAGS